jgi:ketosteroid isomerase-like protein
MSAENVALVRGMYEAFARGDIDGVVGSLDPQVEWIEPYPVGHNPGTHIGPDAVVQNVFLPAVQEWHDFRAQPEEFLDAGDRIVVTGVITGRHKATGRELVAPVCWVWTVRDGKAARNRNYQDTAQWLIAQSAAELPKQSVSV